MVVPLAICTMYTDKENNTHIKQLKYYMVDLTIGNIKCTYLFSQFNYKLLTKTTLYFSQNRCNLYKFINKLWYYRL